MTTKSIKFCEIIQQFCVTLKEFAECVIKPTASSAHLIDTQPKYKKSFTSYVEHISDFNILLLGITNTIKDIIIKLNMLFIDKTEQRLVSFMESLALFLKQIKDSDILSNLVSLGAKMGAHVDVQLKINEKITKITTAVFTICKLTIGITTYFIPELEPINIIVDGLDYVCGKYINSLGNVVEEKKIDVGEIFDKVVELSLNAETLMTIDISIMSECLSDKSANILTAQIKLISDDYVHLIRAMHELQNIIDVYNEKRIYRESKKCFRVLTWFDPC